MAKVNVSYDTVTKAMSASIDGSELMDVVECRFWPVYESEGKFRFCVTTSTEDEDNDTHKMFQICANEAGEIIEDPEFKQEKVSTAVASISKFLSKKAK